MTLRPSVQAEVDRLVAAAINHTPPRTHPIIGARSTPGDERALRGIPAVAEGVAGAIPGTMPHRNPRLERWTRR